MKMDNKKITKKVSILQENFDKSDRISIDFLYLIVFWKT